MAKKSDSSVKASPSANFKDLTAMKSDEIEKVASELKTEIIGLKKGIKSGDVQNYKIGRVKRKDLARALTALNQKSKEEK